MKKFVILVLTIVMVLSMFPVSAIEYVTPDGSADLDKDPMSEIMPLSEATSSADCFFSISGSLAEVTASYVGNKSFSYAKVYLYIQKKVNGSWVAARSDVQSSWGVTSYDSADDIVKTLTLTSRGTYRGRTIMFIYSTSNTHDKWDLNVEKVY